MSERTSRRLLVAFRVGVATSVVLVLATLLPLSTPVATELALLGFLGVFPGLLIVITTIPEMRQRDGFQRFVRSRLPARTFRTASFAFAGFALAGVLSISAAGQGGRDAGGYYIAQHGNRIPVTRDGWVRATNAQTRVFAAIPGGFYVMLLLVVTAVRSRPPDPPRPGATRLTR